MFDFLLKDETLKIITVISFVVGLFGLLYAYILHKKSWVVAKPAYQYKSVKLLDKESKGLPGDIEVLYKNDPIERLTRTFVVFWNDGKKTIERGKISEKEPLLIRFPEDSKILSARIVKSVKIANDIELFEDARKGNEVGITFDYIDHGDGVVIELLHTSEEEAPIFYGQIKEVPNGIVNFGDFILESLYQKSTKLDTIKRWIVTSVMWFFCFILLFGAVKAIIDVNKKEPFPCSVQIEGGKCEPYTRLDAIDIYIAIIGAAFILINILEGSMKRKRRFPSTLIIDKH